MSVLAKIIALGGLAMSLSHATTPMSGFEHVMSHVLDLEAEMLNEPLAVHGSQVALATLAGIEMYTRFLAEFDPGAVRVEECYPNETVMERRIMEGFAQIDPSGKAGAECWADYRQKLEKWDAHRGDFEKFLNEWEIIRPRLQEQIRPAELVLKIMEAVGAPVRWSQLNANADQERVRFAFLHASLMRKRLTLGDLLIFTGWDREPLWEEIWRRYA